jgi:hypothetical protein
MTAYDVLPALYLGNASLLIAHEIDSAYQREWRLFWGLLGERVKPLSDEMGATGFVALHVPLVAAVLWGLIEVVRGTTAGLVMSVALAASGLFAFTAHTLFNRAGHTEFRSALSRSVLWGTLLLSAVQLAIATGALAG